MRPHLSLLLGGLLAWSPGCGGENGPPPLDIPEGCNPLASEWDCLLPYPSDVFLVDDASLPSGKRIRLADRAVPVDINGNLADPTRIHPADGFSHESQILALFPSGVNRDNLVFHTGDVSASLSPDSPTFLLEAETGTPVLHFAETDPRAESDDRRALLLRPMVRLKNQTCYLVALHGLRDDQGSLLPAPEGFRRIRDGEAGDDPVLAPLAEHYEAAVFPQLIQAGLTRADLQLAWDFTTESESMVTRDMLKVRSLLLQHLSAHPPTFTVREVSETDDPVVFRQVDGDLRVPLFLESGEPGARLHRDASGAVTQNGEVDVPFTAFIPRSVAARAPTDPLARVIQYGHGFFGQRASPGEMENLATFLDQAGVVVFAVDWWGMSETDVTGILETIASRPGEILVFSDRVHQGMANFMALTAAIQGGLADAPELQLGSGRILDPEQVYFYGNSMGAILGGTFLALSPRVERGVLGVGGACFPFMMFRANPFLSFLFFIEQYLPDKLDVQKMVALTQTSFDRIDPVTYAPHVMDDTYPDGPSSHRVLMQAGIGDTQVPNLATQLYARALGVSHLQPAPRPIAGLEPVESPWDGSALSEFDFGIDPLPAIEATPAEETNPVHTEVRRLAAGVRQIDRFLRPDGLVEHTCDGVCDPE